MQVTLIIQMLNHCLLTRTYQSLTMSPLIMLRITSYRHYNAFYIILQLCLPSLAFMDNLISPNCQIFYILTLASSFSTTLRHSGGQLFHLYNQSLTVHSTKLWSHFSISISILHYLFVTLVIDKPIFSLMLLCAVLHYVLYFPFNNQHMPNPTLSFV